MTTIDGSDARPVSTIAFVSVLLPASENPLLASESLIGPSTGSCRPPRNFALVVSGLPTNGLNTTQAPAVGESGSSEAVPSRRSSAVPCPTPAEKLPQEFRP